MLRRARRSRSRVPTPLAALLVVAAVGALAWALLLPPMQGPDEAGHVAYVQKLADAHVLPWGTQGATVDPSQPSVSTEALTAFLYGGIEAMRGNLTGRAPSSPVDEARWRAAANRLRPGDRADGGQASVFAYPPLYYIYAAVPYEIATSGSYFDRELVMRLANIPLLLAIVTLTWLIAGELFDRRRVLQTIAAGAVALNPQTVHVSATVDPDPLLAVEWGGVLYLAILALRRGPSPARLAAIAALTVAACLTHPRGLALVPVAAIAIAAALLRHRLGGRRPPVPTLVGVGVIAVAGVLGAVWYGARGLQPAAVRGLASYVWQFYLPRLPWMSPSVRSDWDVRDAFGDRFWTFAQFDVSFSRGVLTALWFVALATLIASAVALWRHRALVRPMRDVAAVLVGAVVIYLLFAHLAAYRGLVRDPTDPVLTGRYLVPLITLYGSLIALAVTAVPRRLAPTVGAVVLSGLALLQVGALGSVLERFYA